jgi:hypothetical protein
MEDIQSLLDGFRATVTPPVTAAGHALPSEAAMSDTPKTRLIHLAYALTDEQATVLLPLVLQWFAKLLGGSDARGTPPRK